MQRTWVALLRAVNVGGRKVPMAELRQALEDAGLAEVRTYIASGNVIFRSEPRPGGARPAARAGRADRFG